MVLAEYEIRCGVETIVFYLTFKNTLNNSETHSVFLATKIVFLITETSNSYFGSAITTKDNPWLTIATNKVYFIIPVTKATTRADLGLLAE